MEKDEGEVEEEGDERVDDEGSKRITLFCRVCKLEKSKLDSQKTSCGNTQRCVFGR